MLRTLYMNLRHVTMISLKSCNSMSWQFHENNKGDHIFVLIISYI